MEDNLAKRHENEMSSLPDEENMSPKEKLRKYSTSFSVINTSNLNSMTFKCQSGSFSSSGGNSQTPSSEEVITTDSSSAPNHLEGKKKDKDIHKGLSRGISLEKELTFGVAESVGRRPKMEDRFQVIPFSRPPPNSNPLRNSNGQIHAHGLLNESNFNEIPLLRSRSSEEKCNTQPNYAFFAIYDGHGGTAAAEFAQDHLHSNIRNYPRFRFDPETALREGIQKTETDFNRKVVEENMDGLTGTTICVALIVGNILYVANVGDSAAIVCRSFDQIIQLTNSHTPKNPIERQRIEKVGGVIKNDRLGHPIWNPGIIHIALSRALGNVYFKDPMYTQGKPSGLIAEPEIVKFKLTKEDQFLLMASDGFWDVMSPKEAVNYVTLHSATPPSVLCKELTDLALKRSAMDNTTVLLVNLHTDCEG